VVRRIQKRTGLPEVELILEPEVDVMVAGKLRSIRSDVSAEMVRASGGMAGPADERSRG
jgi:hypothetical protein